MKRIKRTKITVIRTETVFLRRRESCENPAQARPPCSVYITDEEIEEKVLEIEPRRTVQIKDIEEENK